ncbi:MAG: leucyl/phenylalanyl-tRNA--protein transferase [Chitinophagaceae bacterium]|nr:leucyl/phenylalanyl-tRNA--protein transferase [Chitinophagaceae bacterium]
MAEFLYHELDPFPDYSEADDDGLLAIGGSLSVPRLKEAYSKGIFPWYAPDEPPLWWCPDPRCVLYTDQIKISKSMKQTLRRGHYEFRYNTNFPQVIQHCKMTYRHGQPGTWITEEFIYAYTTLHQEGMVVSAETWCAGELVGGLYGVLLPHLFCGESMFSHQNDASKFALIHLAQKLYNEGINVIDCQLHTPHLESLGAKMIPRTTFLEYLQP